VLVTDGVTEALDGDGRAEERLARAIGKPRTRGAQAICDQLMRLARAGRERVLSGIPQDDRTVVVVTLEA
jgi:serine phosphatase RsbU (regulator of sigma subunit)